jgi:hypothetical protein
MNVHLIKSKELSSSKYWEIFEFLNQHDGPVKFMASEDPSEFKSGDLFDTEVEESDFFKQSFLLNCETSHSYIIPERRTEISWTNLFSQCKKYRSKKSIPEEDMAILLTDIANSKNWFAMADPKFPNNSFVHTDDWEFYVSCPDVYPISYLIASKVLQRKMFNNIDELQDSFHDEPLGCINDFCENKKQIILKLRTADVCYDCLEALRDKGCEMTVIQQVLAIMESVRVRILFSQNFKQNLQPSRLRVSNEKKIYLADYQNIEIKLTPLEKTLYLLFLNHPEGIYLHNLPDHRSEIFNIYGELSGSGMLAEIHNRIDSLIDVTSNSASEKISKIKHAFVKTIGKDLAANYYIKGGNSEAKKIILDRNLIIR